MPKVKVVVRELDEVNVDYVSIVKRGANRIPFRIIKKERGESTMLDLSSLFIRKKEKVEVVPQLVGIVLAKGDYSEELVSQFEDFGLVGTLDQSQENVTLIKSENYDTAEDVAGISMGNGMVAVYANIKKSIEMDDGAMFADVVAVQSIYPSIRVAGETLHEFIYQALYAEGDKGTTLSTISTLLDNYKAYVLSLFDAVPETLYKLEKLNSPVAKTEESTTEEAQAETEVEKSEEHSTESEETNEQPEPDVVVKSEVVNDEAVIIKAELDNIKSMLGTFADTLTVLNTLNETVTALSSRIEKAEKDSSDALTLLNGSTVASAHDDINRVETQKSEGVYDNAFLFPGFEVS